MHVLQVPERIIRPDNALPAFLLAQTVVRNLLSSVDATTARSVEQLRLQCLSAVKDALSVRTAVVLLRLASPLI